MDMTPGFKDHGTSRDAAIAVSGSVADLRTQVRDTLRQFPEGLTADEIATLVDRPVLAVRPRVSGLVKSGFAVKTTERRKNAISGLSAAVLKPALGPL